MPLAATINSSRSLALQNNLRSGLRGTTRALERLSTGKRINRASDDPAGFVAAEELRGELTVKTAELKTYRLREQSLNRRESTSASVQRQVNTLRGEVVAATGDQTSGAQREAIQVSVDASLDAIRLTAGDDAPQALEQLGAGQPANLVNGDPELAAQVVDAVADSVTDQRVAIAAEQRGLQIAQRLAEDQIVITTQALSQVEDADYAAETANLAQSQILTRASIQALAYDQQVQADLIGSLLDEATDTE